MLGRLFLLFTLVPIVELWLLISLGQVIGAPLTVGLVLVTGAIGAWLAKKEGGRVLREWQGAVQRGELPREGLTSSLLVLIGGVLLVTPGVLSDIAGLTLLFPATRRRLAGVIAERVQRRILVQTVDSALQASRSSEPSPSVIDVEVQEVSRENR